MLRKVLFLAFVVVLALVMLTACSGGSVYTTGSGDSNAPSGGSNAQGGGNAPSGGDSSQKPPAKPAGETPGGNADPCPCCPECVQTECACERCADSDDCKCTPGNLLPLSITYDMEIEVELVCHECGYDGCGVVTSGSARVTMNLIDSKTGYFGSAEGFGETLKNGMHELAVKYDVVPGDLSEYGFTAQLSIISDKATFVGADGNYIPVLVGLDKLGAGESTYDFTAWGGTPHTIPSILHEFVQELLRNPHPSDVGTAYPDPGTGFFIFEMPLMEAPIRVLFTWGEHYYIYITLIPVDIS